MRLLHDENSQRRGAAKQKAAVCGFFFGPGKGGTFGRLRPSPGSATSPLPAPGAGRADLQPVLTPAQSPTAAPSLWRRGRGVRGEAEFWIQGRPLAGPEVTPARATPLPGGEGRLGDGSHSPPGTAQLFKRCEASGEIPWGRA